MSRNVCGFILFSTILGVANAARILCVFPYPSHSHQVVYNTLNMALHQRGHELFIFTPNPIKNPNLANYTEIDLSYLYGNLHKNINFVQIKKGGAWSLFTDVYLNSQAAVDKLFANSAMQRLLAPNSTEKFDLVIVQFIFLDGLYILSSRLNCPMIGVSTLQLLSPHYFMLGIPPMTSIAPDVLLDYFIVKMNFWERLINYYYYVRQVYQYLYVNIPLQDAVLKKYFGDDAPSVFTLWSNMSMVMVNTHPLLANPRPMVPSVQYIGAIRFTNQTLENRTLPSEFQNILDKSPQGAIYFSLGSNVKSSHMPPESIKTLLKVFKELPYTVLWKSEMDIPEKISNNIIIRKWLPQREILKHPNVKLFIYQGGIQSTEETIDAVVPVIGMPVFSDQYQNVYNLVKRGAAKTLNLLYLDEKETKEAIVEIITNPTYKKAMEEVRVLLYDVPNNPVDTATWWIEHVIRHKGAAHIRTASRDMHWWQVELVDIMLMFLCILFLASYICFIIARYILKFIRAKIEAKLKTNEKGKIKKRE